MTDTNQLPPHTITINDHPEPHIMQWSDLELAAVKKYAESYAMQALAKAHPAQAEVTPEEVMRAAKEATAPEWQDVVDGWHMGLDLMKFTSLILALRPAAVPMTESEINDLRRYLPFDLDVDDLPEPWAFKQGFRAAERAHGITTQAKKETP